MGILVASMPLAGRLRYVRPLSLLLRGTLIASATWCLCTFHFEEAWSVPLRETLAFLCYETVVACAIWDQNYLHYVGFWSPQLVATAGCFRYVKFIPFAWSLQLVASAMGTLSLQLVTSTMWDLCRFGWSPPLRGTFVASVGRFCYMRSIPFATLPLLRSSLPNRFCSKARTCFASRQVSPKGTHLL